MAQQPAGFVPDGFVPDGAPQSQVPTGFTPDGEASSGNKIMPWLLGAGAVGAGALTLAATRNPAKAWKATKYLGRGANEARRALMLGGLALPKSIGGAGGGAALASIERGSMAPLREMFSMQTLRDAKTAFKAGSQWETAEHVAPNVLPNWIHTPSRIMGAMDDAAQKAFVRAGFTPKEAAREMLQAPVNFGSLNPLMNSAVGQYAVPFRRTPFNQVIEGGRALTEWKGGKGIANLASMGMGAATGYEAEDPKTIGLATALSGRRGLLTAGSAGLAKLLATGNTRKAADALQGISPVSDYSLSQSVLHPTDPFTKPAPVGAAKYLRSFFSGAPEGFVPD